MRSGRPAGSGSACVSAAREPGDLEGRGQACWVGQEGDVTTAESSPAHTQHTHPQSSVAQASGSPSEGHAAGASSWDP